MWRVGEPVLKVDCDRGNFRANRDNLNEAIGGAHGEAEPWVQILLGINAEGASDRMHDGHLGERIRDDQRHGCAKQVSEQDSRACQVNGDIAAEEQTDPDGAANSNHGELALGQAPLQMLRVRR